jgi:hypothetical protein
MRVLPAVLCALALCVACSEPPQKEIDRAQGAIDAAKAAGADVYAPESFKAATSALQEAHAAVAQRDYRLALSRAVDANERALDAAKEAADGAARARSEAEAAVPPAEASLQQLRTRLRAAEGSRLPTAQLAPARRMAAEAQKALQDARRAIAAGEYLAASAALKDVPARIGAEIKRLDQVVAARATRRRR